MVLWKARHIDGKRQQRLCKMLEYTVVCKCKCTSKLCEYVEPHVFGIKWHAHTPLFCRAESARDVGKRVAKSDCVHVPYIENLVPEENCGKGVCVSVRVSLDLEGSQLVSVMVFVHNLLSCMLTCGHAYKSRLHTHDSLGSLRHSYSRSESNLCQRWRLFPLWIVPGSPRICTLSAVKSRFTNAFDCLYTCNHALIAAMPQRASHQRETRGLKRLDTNKQKENMEGNTYLHFATLMVMQVSTVSRWPLSSHQT
jgi:hypothetical protein